MKFKNLEWRIENAKFCDKLRGSSPFVSYEEEARVW
jgi:hypothetical protein